MHIFFSVFECRGSSFSDPSSPRFVIDQKKVYIGGGWCFRLETYIIRLDILQYVSGKIFQGMVLFTSHFIQKLFSSVLFPWKIVLHGAISMENCPPRCIFHGKLSSSVRLSWKLSYSVLLPWKIVLLGG